MAGRSQAGERALQRPRWWRRIGPRLGLTVIVAVIVAEIITIPLWGLIAAAFAPPAADAWYANWTPQEMLAELSVYLLLGVMTSAVLSLVLSRLFLRRLKAMAAITESAHGGDGQPQALPGPYAEEGDDEITQLARALNRSRDQAQELFQRLRTRDARRTEWVAQVSHDLRTPLAALSTCLEQAEARLLRGEFDAPELAQRLAAAREDSERISQLAADLLEIARLETDPQLVLEEVLPAELAEATLRRLAPLAEKRGLELELECGPRLPVLEADGRLLCRALENLVANSLQHARTRVVVRVEGSADGACFSVTDDGEGFPTGPGEVRFREALELRSRADSAGIGLLVTQRVAHAHGGRVSARNLAEGGARVGFEVPRSPGNRPDTSGR